MNIHHDPWIPRQGSLTPLGADYVHGVNNVCDLMVQSGRAGDTQQIDSMFSADDANDIKQIAIGGLEMEDYLS